MRVRFAPSPTGYLHVGGYRTALYNYLLSQKNGGSFILRIEDTDRTRLVDDALSNLIDAMHWGGLVWDEGPYKDESGSILQKGDKGPYIQSERLAIYHSYVQELLDKGAAYFCFCSKERLEELREEQTACGKTPKYDKCCAALTKEEVKARLDVGDEYVIRLNLPENQDISFDDVVFGRITFNTNDLDDQVLIKSDGFPTYHFAVVIDDHLMEITHVIRGEEWISSTPKHVLLYNVFGWQAPQFIHLPTVLNKDKKKLSKRNDDVAVEDFKEKGYLPQALTNFVALLGWSSGQEREMMSLTELVEAFDVSRINRSGAVFDIEKLNWMNASYIKAYAPEELAKLCCPFLNAEIPFDKLVLIVDAVQDKMVCLSDINELAASVLARCPLEDEAAESLQQEATARVLRAMRDQLCALPVFDAPSIASAIKEVQKEENVKGKALYMPIRAAVTGEAHGSDLAKLICAIGREETVARLDETMGWLK